VAEQLLRRPLVAPVLHHDVETIAFLISSLTQVVTFTCDGEHYFIETPLVPEARTPLTLCPCRNFATQGSYRTNCRYQKEKVPPFSYFRP